MLNKLKAGAINRLLKNLSKYLSSDFKPENIPLELKGFFTLRWASSELRFIYKYHLSLKKMINGMQYDRSVPNKFSIALLFNGESEWTEIELVYTKVGKKSNSIKIVSVKASKVWLEMALDSYILEQLFTKTGTDEYLVDPAFFHFLP